jgi:hypothetical protein
MRWGLPVKTPGRYLTCNRKQKAAGGAPYRFVGMEMAAGNGRGDELTVLLPGGRQIEVKRGFESGTLRQVTAVLEQR